MDQRAFPKARVIESWKPLLHRVWTIFPNCLVIESICAGFAALPGPRRHRLRIAIGSLGTWPCARSVATRARPAFGALELRRIEADIDPRNAASCRLVERLGFIREGLLRARWNVAGEICDSAIYGLLAQDREA